MSKWVVQTSECYWLPFGSGLVFWKHSEPWFNLDQVLSLFKNGLSLTRWRILWLKHGSFVRKGSEQFATPPSSSWCTVEKLCTTISCGRTGILRSCQRSPLLATVFLAFRRGMLHLPTSQVQRLNESTPRNESFCALAAVKRQLLHLRTEIFLVC